MADSVMDKIVKNHVIHDAPGILDVESIGLAQNYSLLLSKLEKLAFNHEHSGQRNTEDVVTQRSMSDADYSRFISDIWIGVVLTLLIISIVFFICSCFLYHKFQQWKNSYQTNSSSPGDVIRRYDLDVESLPSYTIVSGLPTYDDALEQFRKAGIIIPQPSIVNIFEDAAQIKTSPVENTDNTDTASINSCTCDATTETGLPSSSTATVPSVIELNPDQLNLLSRKRLSLQIALNSNQQSRQSNRIDLCREVNRSNLMRSHDLPQIHRSTSSSSLSAERIYAIYKFPSYFQHRGSLA